ncbi:MAG TPA: DUF998 domain-containing protein [Ktedonobacteraceae bacterium]
MNQRFITRLLLACGMIGPLLFIIVFLIEGATRPGYSAWRHAVSQLSLGDQGWMNSINIFVCGLFLLCFAFGLRLVLQSGKASFWGPSLTLLCGVLFITAAIFPVNPALGYLPGVAPTYSLHGLIHALAVTIFFGCLSALCFVLGQRFVDGADWTGWALYSRITGVVVALFYIATPVVTTLDMNGLLPNAPGGLLQRVAIISGFGWIMLLALRLMRQEKQVRASRSENLRAYIQE